MTVRYDPTPGGLKVDADELVRVLHGALQRMDRLEYPPARPTPESETDD